MKLWLISQTTNDGWDTFDSAVVAAETEDEARATDFRAYKPDDHLYDEDWREELWTTPDNIDVVLIGEALPHITAGVICASFNAG